MDYRKHYEALIQRAKSRIYIGYTERHHIIPRCLGGDDSKENLVRLTPEEHYVAHQFLVKLYPKHRGLIYSVFRMTTDRWNNRNNKLYGWVRRQLAEASSAARKGKPAWNSGTTGMCKAWNKGIPMSEEQKQKLRAHTRTEEQKQKISKAKIGKVSDKQLEQLKSVHQSNRGKPRPASQKEAVRKALTGRIVSEETKAKQRLAQQQRRQREERS